MASIETLRPGTILKRKTAREKISLSFFTESIPAFSIFAHPHGSGGQDCGGRYPLLPNSHYCDFRVDHGLRTHETGQTENRDARHFFSQ
jgi:hypothetical protein